ncbi:hypothetical protein Nther_2435 [Natranaerobius thermophilus JW/NM-WN-LF]|uniref:Uncharacterized protein n=1 Tax=Natranaerobius thermophilus (strain ATCC BAA-1301 / DSM 18059 / JW/NM-WN-LF) TaxID=457570 RepID=B2A0X1_NATTJ|nr:hypothetical protein Nther_2435 [Natranaerobius thermophilus JW/NM-WN-LF]
MRMLVEGTELEHGTECFINCEEHCGDCDEKCFDLCAIFM